MSYYPIELDKSRNMRYGMRALDRIEKQLKTKIAKLDMNDLSIQETATIIWAGLVHEDRELTADKVIDLIDEYSSMTKVSEVMNEAFMGAFGDGEETTEEGKN